MKTKKQVAAAVVFVCLLVFVLLRSPQDHDVIPWAIQNPEWPPLTHGVEQVRDPFRQPFSSTSIWNHPLGKDAMYTSAQLEPSQQYGVFAEEEIIVLTPNQPLMPIYLNTADWIPGRIRGIAEGPVLAHLPIPRSFHTEGFLGATPNHAASVLMPDGRTVVHHQPFMRLKNRTYATSRYYFGVTDLYGEGIAGAHGGSGLSALGGTIRLGELVPGGVIPHALKLAMHSRWFAYQRDATPGYRWPATKADAHASPLTYRGAVPALEMGALLALPPSFPIQQLQTEPGQIVARALQDFGGYVCDSAGWDAYYLATEWSPNGRVLDEFSQVWGYDFVMKDITHPWSQDLARIIEALHVIANNHNYNRGGGGVLRRPLAPPLTIPADLGPGVGL